MTVGSPKRGAKPDELALWARVVAGERPRDAGRGLGIPSGRVEYLCLKWASAGIYEYGVSSDLGWPIGREVDWSKPLTLPPFEVTPCRCPTCEGPMRACGDPAEGDGCGLDRCYRCQPAGTQPCDHK